ncbi:hypothetical protein QBC37DRAFT_143333 [Rhypophila decipiens]|uniref:Fungal N-terminal domain-containing protein n=1 Tax=Rhypophila decipiens TaxID=261697 RepID=A0AAN7B0A3_9PEZI|nr:hypothetical protein QBC37DRAFT_143333 [Rhypophila decipiens]
MDPLSAAASAIALLQAAAAIGKGIKTIRSFGRAPAELCSLLNELTTLQALSSQFEQDIRRLKDDSCLLSDKHNASLFNLSRVHQELSATVEQLESLVERFIRSSKGLNKHGQYRIPPIRWQLERANVLQLCKTAERTRENLTAIMTSIQLTTSMEQSKLILRVEQSFAVSARHLDRTVQKSSELVSEVHRAVLDLHERMDTLEREKSTLFLEQSLEADSILCFQTSLRTKCDTRCRCQCHKCTSRVSPGYLQPAVGAFFLSYKTFPIFSNSSCNDAACQRRQHSRLELYYYLPRWLFSRAVHISLSWDSLHGTGATVHLRLPRIIETSDDMWETIRCRDLTRLRQRLALKQNTLMDVSPTGTSLLLYAVTRGNFDIIKHLLVLGCDVTARDIRGSSPATVARSRLLAGCTEPNSSVLNGSRISTLTPENIRVTIQIFSIS